MMFLCLHISQIISSTTFDIIMSKWSKWIFLYVQCIVFMVISKIHEKTSILIILVKEYKHFFANNILCYSPSDGQGCFSIAANCQLNDAEFCAHRPFFHTNFCVSFWGEKWNQLFIKFFLTNDDYLINYYNEKCQTVIHVHF